MATAIDRTELLRLINTRQAQVVDVLPRAEHEESHLPGAVSIPLRDLTRETVTVLSRERPVVVYCHDGL